MSILDLALTNIAAAAATKVAAFGGDAYWEQHSSEHSQICPSFGSLPSSEEMNLAFPEFASDPPVGHAATYVLPTRLPQFDSAMTSTAAAAAATKILDATKFKTKMCKNYLATGLCPYEDRCMFAHGKTEMRSEELNLRDNLTTEGAVREWRKVQTQTKRGMGAKACLVTEFTSVKQDGSVPPPSYLRPKASPATSTPPSSQRTVPAVNTCRQAPLSNGAPPRSYAESIPFSQPPPLQAPRHVAAIPQPNTVFQQPHILLQLRSDQLQPFWSSYQQPTTIVPQQQPPQGRAGQTLGAFVPFSCL